MRDEPVARVLRAEEVESCAGTLARAFASDPVYRFLHPDDGEWARAGPRLFRILLRHFASRATILTPGSAAAVAIWSPPEPNAFDGFARLRLTLRLGVLLGRRISRGARVGSALESLHREEPHWYLAILGTAPEAQGRGFASSLLEPMLKRCDSAGLPAHLETATEANLAFYAARGFVVVGETIVAGGGPRIWGLRRAPDRHLPRFYQGVSSTLHPPRSVSFDRHVDCRRVGRHRERADPASGQLAPAAGPVERSQIPGPVNPVRRVLAVSPGAVGGIRP